MSYKLFSNLFKFFLSGEIAFRTISECFLYAKYPMVKRIDSIENIPIYFIYGADSWIESKPGFQAASLRTPSSPTYVKIIMKAGHHVYADKSDEFNEFVREILISMKKSGSKN